MTRTDAIASCAHVYDTVYMCLLTAIVGQYPEKNWKTRNLCKKWKCEGLSYPTQIWAIEQSIILDVGIIDTYTNRLRKQTINRTPSR